ncbi:MAG: YbdD/YjiX family protein [Candidatus Competibacteraceae bacterium]|nr:YbdD/YjiX family protein [Candidatus Competibacteraceae bacterium]
MQPHTKKSVSALADPDQPAAGAKTWLQRLARFNQALRRIIGAPDYAAYLARHRHIHPDVPPMSEKEFFRFAIDRRYAKAGPRCC